MGGEAIYLVLNVFKIFNVSNKDHKPCIPQLMQPTYCSRANRSSRVLNQVLSEGRSDMLLLCQLA